MAKRCVFYVTDKNYFFPTAVSALGARSKCSTNTSVLVFLSEPIGLGDDPISDMKRSGIEVIDASDFLAGATKHLSRDSFRGSISVTAMGRLLADQLLGNLYEEAIYLDGDTLIHGSLNPLENLKVDAGAFAASLDYLSLIVKMAGKPYERYFNSGVLKFNPGNWPGREAFDYFSRFPEKCLPYHDQGALNIVGKTNLLLISNRWNFPKQFLPLLTARQSGANESQASDEMPEIVHFMSQPKPWHGNYYPFRKNQTDEYARSVVRFPWLLKFWKKLPVQRQALYRMRSIRDVVSSMGSGPWKGLDVNQAFAGPWKI